MSMIENLEHIREFGLEDFVALEKERWACTRCGGAICVHDEACIYCGHVRRQRLVSCGAVLPVPGCGRFTSED
ncbi:MAG: hypothetical protein KKA32_05025 [Actinobacteria bacterium]|nr:hypothetical protein [Actinomycetota bacterium]